MSKDWDVVSEHLIVQLNSQNYFHHCSMNSKIPKSESQWQPCDQGLIQGASESNRGLREQQSRRQFLRKASAAAVVVAGAGFVGWSVLGENDPLKALHGNPNFPGGIACSEVRRLLPEYIGGSLSSTDLVSSIDTHLTECKDCCENHDSLIELA